MTNPARELAKLLTAWNLAENQSCYQIRGAESPGDENFWRSQAEAVNLVYELQIAMSGLEAVDVDVEYVRTKIPAIYQCIFYTWGAWKQRVDHVFDEDVIGVLTIVANLIDSHADAAALTSVTPEELRDRLDGAKTAILDATFLPKGIRTYMLGLVSEALVSLDDFDVGGTVKARALLAQLSTEMLATVDHVPVAERPAWVQRAFSLIKMPGAAFLGALGSDTGTKAIEAISEAIANH